MAFRVNGLREFIRACDNADKDTKRYVRQELRDAADTVREDAEQLFQKYSPESAAGYRVRVRQSTGVSVEQSLRKVTGLRPDWGSLQMRKALLPAAYDNQDDLKFRLELVIGRIVRRFGK